AHVSRRSALDWSHAQPLPITPAFFSFNAPSPPALSTLPLRDALPIWPNSTRCAPAGSPARFTSSTTISSPTAAPCAMKLSSTKRSEEHTSELQSLTNLVCRLLLEKKKHTQSAHLIALHSISASRTEDS